VQVANQLGMNGIRHSDYESTRQRLGQLGLEDKEG
jgi:hypothetical protein